MIELAVFAVIVLAGFAWAGYKCCAIKSDLDAVAKAGKEEEW